VAKVVYSARSLDQLEGACQALRQQSVAAAADAGAAIQSAIETLARHPFVGWRCERELRELVISYGPIGFLALYRFVVSRDEVRVLALRRQRELLFVP
jgi:plasmid stabilization system protein ParE